MKTKRFKAAWFDIDKTLIEDHGKLSEEMEQALKKIPGFGVNTQRSVGQVEKAMPFEKITLPSIILSGSEVWDLGKKAIKTFPLSKNARLKVAETALKNSKDIALARFYPQGNRNIVLYVATDELEKKFVNLYKETNSFGKMTRSLEEFTNWLKNEETCMITLRTHIKTELKFPTELKETVEIDSSSKTDFVITAKNVRKATSLLWLCDYLGINPEDVVTAGDNPAVDGEIFEHTYGISVGSERLENAQRNVKTVPELAELLNELFDETV